MHNCTFENRRFKNKWKNKPYTWLIGILVGWYYFINILNCIVLTFQSIHNESIHIYLWAVQFVATKSLGSNRYQNMLNLNGPYCDNIRASCINLLQNQSFLRFPITNLEWFGNKHELCITLHHININITSVHSTSTFFLSLSLQPYLCLSLAEHPLYSVI